MISQGSIVSPSVYMGPLELLMSKLGLRYFQYADDTQVWISICSNLEGEVTQPAQHLTEIGTWVRDSWLRLNPDKTEIVFL